MGSEMKIIFLQELTRGLLNGLLKPKLNRLFTRTPFLAALLLTAVVAACAGPKSSGPKSSGPTPVTADCVFAEDNGTQDCGLIVLPQVFNYAAIYNITVGKETTIGFGELGLSNFTFTQIINGNISDPKSVPSPVSNNNQLMLLANATAINLNISGIDDNVFGEFYIDLVQHNNTAVTVRYTISITPVNDPPVFEEVMGSESQFIPAADTNPARYRFADIPFNSIIGYSVGNVSTTDVDNDTIAYSIDGGTDDTDLFQINPTTGEITLKAIAVNTGDDPIEYTFNLTASDRKGGSARIEITVSVLSDNQAPMFLPVSGAGSQFASASTDGTTPANYNFTGIPLSSAMNGLVGNVLAMDPDAADGDAVTYNISNEYNRDGGSAVSNDLFQINSATGEITLLAVADTLGEYTFNITANDGKGGTATATISVHVDGSAPVFTQTPYNFNLDLSVANAAGVVVDKVSAMDNERTLFTYSLAGSGDLFDDLFELAAANPDDTRNITLRRAVTIDDLTEFPVTFQVEATHQVGGFSSDAAVTVNLNNDLPPDDDSDGDGIANFYDADPNDPSVNVNGSGEPSDPYIISNIYQLQAIAGVDHTGTALDSSIFTSYVFLYGADAAEQLTKHYKLANDIDASNTTDTAVWAKPAVGSNNFIGRGWTPIAGGENQEFSGSFAGEGYHIHNLSMNLQVANNKDTFGLFGTNGGNISAVGLTNINMQIAAIDGSFTDSVSLAGNGETDSYTLGSGALAGTNSEGGSIKYAYSTGIVNVEGLYTGGLVGVNIGNVTYSYSTVNVTGRRDTGGLVGAFGVPVTTTAEISSSYATGNVTVIENITNVYPGGLVGAMAKRSSIRPAKIITSYAGNAKESVKRGDGVEGGPIIGTFSPNYRLDVSYSHWTNSTSATDDTDVLFFSDLYSSVSGLYTLAPSEEDVKYSAIAVKPKDFLNCGLDDCTLNNTNKTFPSPHWGPNLGDPGIERGWIFEDGKYPALYANRTLNSVTTSLMPSIEAQDCHRIQVADACGTYDAVE